MNNERLKEVIKILDRYDESSVINYYELFGISKNLSIENINQKIKESKLQVLFHPDQIKFIPESYHSKYNHMIEEVVNFVNIFSNDKSREKYDDNLAKSEVKTEYSDEDKTEDLEELKLVQSLMLNAQKYGFDYTRKALSELLSSNYTQGFTRENDVRKMIESIDRNKLLSIVSQSSSKDEMVTSLQMSMNYLTDLMYKIPELKQQINFLDEACNATFGKYDANGYSGQTYNALNKYCITNNVAGFTNVNNVRNNLKEYGDFRNSNFYIECILNSKRFDNLNYAYTNMINNRNDFNKGYVDMLHEQYNLNKNSGYSR